MHDSPDVISRYGALAAALLVVATLSATVITSCGSGGGNSDSNGALCEQCGETDGPCQTEFSVAPGPSQPPPCNVEPSPGDTAGCHVTLICRRESDSAQQRCFPQDPRPGNTDPNFQWECKGHRAGGTAVPEPTLTPVPTNTAVTPTPTPTIAII
jgi:hypothetical protein